MQHDRRSGEDRRDGVRGGRRASDWMRLVSLRIGEAMRKRRMTNRHMALRANLDERTVRNVLDGCDTKVSTIEKMADVLDLDITAFISPPAA